MKIPIFQDQRRTGIAGTKINVLHLDPIIAGLGQDYCLQFFIVPQRHSGRFLSL